MVSRATAGPAKRLRALMRARNWTYRDVAVRAGMASPSQIGNILGQLDKRADGIAPRTARRLADAFEVPLAELFPEIAGMSEDVPAAPPTASALPPRAEPAVTAVPDPAPDLRGALALAFDGRRHSLDDLRALDDLVRHDRVRMELAEGDLVAAARRLRMLGQELSFTGLLLALAAPHEAAPRDPRADEKIAALRALAPTVRAPDKEIEPPLDPIGDKADPSRPVK
jgi:transcriptional regulator with XRE-family HTH domain